MMRPEACRSPTAVGLRKVTAPSSPVSVETSQPAGALQPRLVRSAEAATYCALSIAKFRRYVVPKIRSHRFGNVTRYDLREIDFLLDRRSRAATHLRTLEHAIRSDSLTGVVTRVQAAALCNMNVKTFDRSVRPYLSETAVSSGANAAIYFLRQDIDDFWLRRFNRPTRSADQRVVDQHSIEQKTRDQLNVKLRKKGRPTI
jgi:hypothetical protein